MFKLLSKESNIFSVPVYLGVLLFIVISFNVLNINTLNIISAILTFAGISMGYFLFNKINLTRRSHLPLFLYSVLVFTFYPGYLDIGIAISLFTNSYVLFLLTENKDYSRNSTYVLIGSLLMVNFIFLPTTFPLIFFVIFHIILTSDRIFLNILRLFFGMILIGTTYFSLAYFWGLNQWNPIYLPINYIKPFKDFKEIYILSPVILLLVYSVLDHYFNYNKKSPTSRFKYGLILIFSLSQLITIVLFMGKNYEYLLLIAFPATIILSRMLRFLRKYWVKEVELWMIVISLIIFKILQYFYFM
ncbi:MAG: DUF6427 family protein [Flavobacteriaceae bacterium]|jgi:hypothetical protein|nr:DUF6427 family protein [Flavobacteriaceae bacterium]